VHSRLGDHPSLRTTEQDGCSLGVPHCLLSCWFCRHCRGWSPRGEDSVSFSPGPPSDGWRTSGGGVASCWAMEQACMKASERARWKVAYASFDGWALCLSSSFVLFFFTCQGRPLPFFAVSFCLPGHNLSWVWVPFRVWQKWGLLRVSTSEEGRRRKSGVAMQRASRNGTLPCRFRVVLLCFNCGMLGKSRKDWEDG